MISFIYMIAPSEKPPIKIGRADNVDSRLISLQVGNPAELFILARFPVPWASAQRVEREVHQRLEEKRRRGEWFDVSADEADAAIRAAIADVANEGIDPKANVSELEDLLIAYRPHPWARSALHYYHVCENTRGMEGRVQQMNALILREAGNGALLAFQAVRQRNATLFNLKRRDPAAHRLACDAVAKAIIVLSDWYVSSRQAGLLDKISRNAA